MDSFPSPSLSPEQKQLVEQALTKARDAYGRGFGFYTSSDPNSQFGQEIWTRDVAVAIASMARTNPAACIESLASLIGHIKSDGSIPLRIEWVRHWANYVQPFPWLRSHGLDFMSRKTGYAVFERIHGALPARDTVPSLIIACAQLYKTSRVGRDFVALHWEKLDAAMERETGFTDADGLLIGGKLQDWADSIARSGKLATVNGIYVRALQEMAFMTAGLGKDNRALAYTERYEQVHTSYMRVFWREHEGYIRAAVGDNTIDAMANVYACLYHVGPVQAVRIQEKLQKLVAPNGLLRNFDTPYPRSMIAARYRLAGIGNYHNTTTWPWVTTENILAKLRIARLHPDPAIRQQFFLQSEADFVTISSNHMKNGDFYEVVDPETGAPMSFRRFGLLTYRSSVGFMESIATYIAAAEELETVRGLVDFSTVS